MPLTINSSPEAHSITRNLDKALKAQQKSFEQLSSGKRINRASDDAAGLAIAAKTLADADVQAVAARNTSDAVSVTDVASALYSGSSDIVNRLSELAAQSANGTLSDTQRTALDQEFQSLTAELDRQSAASNFNGQQLSGGSFSFNVGSGQDVQLNVATLTSAGLGLNSQSIATQGGAQTALDQLKTARDSINQQAGQVGAVQSQLLSNYDRLQNQQPVLREVASRIQDADIAEATSNLVRNKILSQGSAALLAQANISQKTALQLLK
jgi:flagellin